MSLRKSPRKTPALLAACRANARKSKGPKANRSKARTCLNALKHGQYASLFRAKLVRLEDKEALRVYDASLASAMNRINMVDTEKDLEAAERLACREWCAWWRSRKKPQGPGDE